MVKLKGQKTKFDTDGLVLNLISDIPISHGDVAKFVITFVSMGVMIRMLAMWAGGPMIDTWSGTFSSNHYFNGLRYMVPGGQHWHCWLCLCYSPHNACVFSPGK